MRENTESLTSSKMDEKPVNGSLHYVLYRDTIRLSASGVYRLIHKMGGNGVLARFETGKAVNT